MTIGSLFDQIRMISKRRYSFGFSGIENTDFSNKSRADDLQSLFLMFGILDDFDYNYISGEIFKNDIIEDSFLLKIIFEGKVDKSKNYINELRRQFSIDDLGDETSPDDIALRREAILHLLGVENNSDNMLASKALSFLGCALTSEGRLDNADVSLKTVPSRTWVERVGEEAASTTPLPQKAPALWKQDKQKGDTPVIFIQRHYAPWLDGKMTRRDIKRLDEPLYRSLYSWLRSNELPEGFDLPTAKDANDRLLSSDSIPSDQLSRAASAAARRR